MKKILRVGAAVAGIAIIGVLLLFADGFLGNPISKFRGQNTAKKYISENYNGMNYKVEKAQYDFKSGGYYVKITSQESADLNFYLSLSRSGKLNYDSYESDVQNGFNTWIRLDLELREMGRGILENELPFEIIHGSFSFEKDAFEPGLLTHGMVLDIMNPPLPISVNVDIMDKDVSYEKAAEVLTSVGDVVLQKGYPVSFYNLKIEYKSEDQNSKGSYKSLFIYNIPSDLLLVDDLAGALEEFNLSQYTFTPPRRFTSLRISSKQAPSTVPASRNVATACAITV